MEEIVLLSNDTLIRENEWNSLKNHQKPLKRIEKEEDLRTIEKHSRSIWRNKLTADKRYIIDWFKNKENQLIIQKQLILSDPFQSLSKNEPQTILQNKLDNKLFERFQFITLSAPCAAGKTLMGLQIIHYLGLKTLIISCRTSIKEQWEKEIKRIWPNVKVNVQSSETKKNKTERIDKTNDFDIFIVSPQWLSLRLDSFSKNENDSFKNENEKSLKRNEKDLLRIIIENVNLIIFDEIHSMCGDSFSKSLNIFRLFNHYIYMCGLSATFPKLDTDDGKLLYSIFGSPIQLSSKAIVSRNVYVYDFRDKCETRGHLDQYWNGLSVRQVIKRVCEGIEGIPKLETFDKNHKFLCVCEEVQESFKCANMILHYFESLGLNRKIVIVRESTKGSFIVPIEFIKNHPKEFNENDITKECEMISISEIDNSDTVGVFGCNARLREGINIKTLIFGISTNFNYSIAFRIQILGRIRRTDEDIKRFFIVNSGKDPNDSKYWNRQLIKKPTKITYSFDYENQQFERNGIYRI